MNTEEFVKDIENTYKENLTILKKKNNDYSGSQDDPFKNFKLIESFNLMTAEQGIFVRITDKMSRLSNALKGNKLKVSDESIQDTISDAINYLAILKSLIKSRKE